jgi:ribosome-binding ATPase
LQVSGYGSTLSLVQKTLDASGIKAPLEEWDEETLKAFVDFFLDIRFPTILALNKIDSVDADKNIDRICRKFGSVRIDS